MLLTPVPSRETKCFISEHLPQSRGKEDGPDSGIDLKTGPTEKQPTGDRTGVVDLIPADHPPANEKVILQHGTE